VQQFLEEGHLRWDSLGEYLAIAVSLEHLGQTTNNDKALVLSKTLNQAIERLLQNNKSPSRKVHEIDNRASSFYIALYWADFMAKEDPKYKDLADQLKTNRSKIVEEFSKCQGAAVDIGGYYRPDASKASAAMRPSATFNAIMDLAKA
jgi:isocitrate dehydrogenase